MRRGMTLLEVLLVLAILGVALAAAAPRATWGVERPSEACAPLADRAVLRATAIVARDSTGRYRAGFADGLVVGDGASPDTGCARRAPEATVAHAP
ncbi:MAG: type II secretion system protein [Gemmatimonadetes bacterium]|nr:type II secretion system protein [Gemmatimonadota bacterium]